MGFELREARLQDTKNRQNSIKTTDRDLKEDWSMKQMEVINLAKKHYEWATKNGIAKEQLNKELEKEKKRLLKHYEARLLDRFNDESRNLENEMRSWKEAKNNKDKFLEVRTYIDENRAQIEKKLEDVPVQISDKSSKQIVVGSKVKLEEGSETGVVLELKNNNAVVAFGNLQTKVKMHQLIVVEEKKGISEQKRNTYSSKILIEKSEFDYNLDLRGLMKDEAITALDNFMDRAIMYGIHNIKIIHGRGTGALKQAVQFYLKKYPHVKSFRYENDQFGGDGITLVEMK